MIVIDSSIAAKWFLPDNLSEAAIALLAKDRKLISPDIVRDDVAATIIKAASLDKIASEMASAMINRWVKMLDSHVVSLVAAEVEFAEATRISLELRHPLRECFYLAAARRLKVPLATTDKRQIEQSNKINVEVFHLN